MSTANTIKASTLNIARTYAKQATHKGRPAHAAIFHGEDVGSYLVAIGPAAITRAIAAGFEEVR